MKNLKLYTMKPPKDLPYKGVTQQKLNEEQMLVKKYK